MRKEAAFSGLEAAIVLIAFVVVAAVFAYVMLGAGFFATQKSQEVTYSGIKQATSNIVLDGQMYGIMSSADGTGAVRLLTFFLAVPEGGQPQNLDYENLKFKWTVTRTTMPDSRNVYGPQSASPSVSLAGIILRPGDKQEVQLKVPTAFDGATVRPRAGDSFTLEIIPNTGAASLVTKSLVTGYKGGVII